MGLLATCIRLQEGANQLSENKKKEKRNGFGGLEERRRQEIHGGPLWETKGQPFDFLGSENATEKSTFAPMEERKTKGKGNGCMLKKNELYLYGRIQ